MGNGAALQIPLAGAVAQALAVIKLNKAETGSDGQAGRALLVGNGASSYWGGGGRAGQLSGNPEFALAPAAGVHTIIAIHTRQDVAGTELMACW